MLRKHGIDLVQFEQFLWVLAKYYRNLARTPIG